MVSYLICMQYKKIPAQNIRHFRMEFELSIVHLILRGLAVLGVIAARHDRAYGIFEYNIGQELGWASV